MLRHLLTNVNTIQTVHDSPMQMQKASFLHYFLFRTFYFFQKYFFEVSLFLFIFFKNLKKYENLSLLQGSSMHPRTAQGSQGWNLS
jgi:hypothetical protein